MKKLIAVTLILILSLSVLTGCRGRNTEPATAATTMPATMPSTHPTTLPTTAPTTQATTEPTTDTTMDDTMPDLIPGPEDTVDPENGANESTGEARYRRRSGF